MHCLPPPRVLLVVDVSQCRLEITPGLQLRHTVTTGEGNWGGSAIGSPECLMLQLEPDACSFIALGRGSIGGKLALHGGQR